MNLDRQTIDHYILQYSKNPTKDNFFLIKNWYEQQNQNYSDQEYMLCVYIFLLAANIKKQWIPFDKEQHHSWVKFIRESIELSNPIYKSQRKAYLDYGSKAGFYK